MTTAADERLEREEGSSWKKAEADGSDLFSFRDLAFHWSKHRMRHRLLAIFRGGANFASSSTVVTPVQRRAAKKQATESLEKLLAHSFF
jgi:hypothetical protein